VGFFLQKILFPKNQSPDEEISSLKFIISEFTAIQFWHKKIY